MPTRIIRRSAPTAKQLRLKVMLPIWSMITIPNSATDVFVKNWRTGAIVRASDGVTTMLGNGFSHTPALSGDGKHVAYFSDTLNASGLFDVYLD